MDNLNSSSSNLLLKDVVITPKRKRTESKKFASSNIETSGKKKKSNKINLTKKVCGTTKEEVKNVKETEASTSSQPRKQSIKVSTSINESQKAKNSTKSKSTKKIKTPEKQVKSTPATIKVIDSKLIESDSSQVENTEFEIISTKRNLPNYTAKFGLEDVKVDRYKLDSFHVNFLNLIIDEIGLEGLDGITLEALWTRISVVTKEELPLPNHIKQFIWNVITSSPDIEFYVLPEPRPKLVIFNRNDYIDPDLGAIIDPSTLAEDIYPYTPCKEKEVLGSANSFYDRKEISSEIKLLPLADAEEQYGSRLVIVATQRLRKRVLTHSLADPLVEFSQAQFCLLERIGRSRHQGETTQGKMSLQLVSKDPKVIFYNRKHLADHKLICKQPFFMKTSTGTTLVGSLLQLLRFYNERKTKTQIMTEQFVEVLRNRPLHRIEYSEAKAIFGNLPALTKLFKLPEFQRFIRTDVQVNYRDMYPNASVKEWKHKSSVREKKLRILELINPSINVGGSWNEEEKKEESSDDEDTEEIIYNKPLLHQIYNCVREGGYTGKTIKEIQFEKGLDFYTVRAAVNRLLQSKFVIGLKFDAGRQRMIRYHATVWKSNEDEVFNLTRRDPNFNDSLEIDSIDFLSDLLQVEPEFLILLPSSEEDTINPSTSNESTYELIKNLKQQVKREKTDDAVENLEQSTNAVEEHSPIARLAEIISNEHEYQKVATELHKPNENISLGSISQNIISYSNLIEAQQNKNKKKKKLQQIHLKLLYQETDEKAHLILEEVLLNTTPPLIVFQRDISYNTYKRFCRILLKYLAPILIHFKYQIRVLEPKKRYLCRERRSRDDLLKFAHNHPMLSLTDNQLPSQSGNKRKAKLNENGTVKKLRVEESESETMQIYMGPKPTIISRSVDSENIETTILVSTKPEEFLEVGSKYVKDNNLTLQTMKRASCILNVVRQEKVVLDIRRLHKLIFSHDAEQGYNVRVDKKSIARIYTRLVKGGDIKIFKIILKCVEFKRSTDIICDPSFDINDSIIISAIEQLKMKFSHFAKKKEIAAAVTPAPAKETVELENCERYSTFEDLSTLINNDIPCTYEKSAGKDYGHLPKFQRMRVLHEFLFYLIYYNSSKQRIKDVDQFIQDLNIDVDEETKQNLPPVYCTELNSKMFIPPLPIHSGWEKGWTLVCDIIVRIPLSLFVKLCNISFIIPELTHYLDHPIKQYYLIRHLPIEIRNGLLFKRKYVFSIHETLSRLCYIGVLQFGPQKLREKDQVFIYLNRNATLLDTTTNNVGYHKTEEKEYKQIKYNFLKPKDVEAYWYEMWNICAHSNLGHRSLITGTYQIFEQLETKPAMLEAMIAQNPDSALNNDDGHIPGDGRGAAGLDTALWSHLKRNWFWASRTTKADNSAEIMPSKTPKSKKQKKINSIKSVIKSTEDNTNTPSSSKNSIIKKSQVILSKKLKKSEKSKKKKFIRKMYTQPEPKSKKGYDHIDKKLMAVLKQSRSEWNEEEDLILRICRIVSFFLCPNTRKQFIHYTVVRDVLHKISACSVNKTSSACQRRLNAIFGPPDQQLCLAEVAKSLLYVPFVRKYFYKIDVDIREGKHLNEQLLNGSFVFLVIHFFNHQHELRHVFEKISFKTKFEPEKLKMKSRLQDSHIPGLVTNSLVNKSNVGEDPYEVIAYEPVVTGDMKPKLYYSSKMAPNNEYEILLDTLKSIIHSTIETRQDDVSWIYQLYRVYQNYSDDMIKKVLTEIRNSQMISLRKSSVKRAAEGDTLPVTTRLFQFSYSYNFTQITKFPLELFPESHEMFLGIFNRRDVLYNISFSGLPMECCDQGHIVGLAELACDIKYNFIVEIPKEVLVLNPSIADHTDLIRELAVRYKKMLTLLKDGSYFQDANDGNLDESSTDMSFQVTEKSATRVPMVQRFLKSWFLSEVGLEEEIREETDDGTRNEEGTASETEGSKNVEESAKKTSSVKADKKKKRLTKMTSEETKTLLRSLNAQFGNKPEQPLKEANPTDNIVPLPLAIDDADISFEDCEKKLESILSVKPIESFDTTSESTFEEGDDVNTVPLTEVFDNDSNVLETYLKSKRNLISSSASKKDSNKQIESVEQRDDDGGKENAEPDLVTNIGIQYLTDDKLTVEEIMEQMLLDCPEEERKVPKLIHLARLLVTGLFPELDEDEDRLEQLQKHFLIICPETNIKLDSFEETEEIKYISLEHLETCKRLLRKVQMDIIINEALPTPSEITSTIKDLDGSDTDVLVAESIIEFVYKKRSMGASIKQIKEHFTDLGNLKLSTMLNALTNINILMRTGISCIVYVHHKYRKPWFVQSCTLQDQDKQKLREKKTEDNEDVDLHKLASSLESCTEIKVKVTPWARIDGTLNLKIFEKWIGTILARCISDTNVSLLKLINSCCFLKPVDVYYLVECLQELGCVQLYVYNVHDISLFSSVTYVERVPATITDDLDDIFIEPDKMAVIKYGTLLNKKLKEFDFGSDETKRYGTL